MAVVGILLISMFVFAFEDESAARAFKEMLRDHAWYLSSEKMPVIQLWRNTTDEACTNEEECRRRTYCECDVED